MSAHAVRAEPHPRRLGPGYAGTLALGAISGAAWATIGIALALAAIAFGEGDSAGIARPTTVEIVLTLAAGVAVAAAVALQRRGARLHGSVAVAALAALAALSAVSIVWSVSPSDSWLEANRVFSYTAVLAMAVALVRLAPQRWPSVLGGVALASVIVCGWALLTKVFPVSLNPQELYARLREPYGYWNAVGLTAAMGVPPLLWLGARRFGHAAVNALAYPATGLLLVALLLAYSRGALIALVLGCAFWFASVPLRLRGAAILLSAGVSAATVVAWDFSQPALSLNRLDAGLRYPAGHDLGIALVAMVLVLGAVGLGVGFLQAHHPLGPRRREQVGLALLVALALVPVAVAGALTLSSRGLVGSVSHAANALVDPHGGTPNTPSRLTSVASVRARYWNEALKVFSDHPVLGAGAGGYAVARDRYSSSALLVRHAHGYVVEVLADLGLVGLALNLLALGGWLVAAIVTTRPFGWRVSVPWRRTPPAAPAVPAFTPERIGQLTLATCVLVFGLHSLIDWTWSVAGCACMGLLCAGWVAGRGPLPMPAASEAAASGAAASGTSPPPAPPRFAPAIRPLRPPVPGLPAVRALWLRARDWVDGARALEPSRQGAAVGVLALAVVIAWAQWQPLRAQGSANDALAALARHDVPTARSDARRAADQNPVAVDPLFEQAAVETAAGDLRAAHDALERAVTLAPSNARTWLRLAEFELDQGANAPAALRDLRTALYLAPNNPEALAQFLVATRRTGAPNAAAPLTITAPVGPKP